MLKNKKSNCHKQRSSSALKRARKNIFAQALLAALMVFLTVVIVFAITAAWYTNVVQTGGLVFEAETWGFDGTLQLGNGQVIKAAPGEEGVIPLTAQNNSNSVAAVSVNINKTGMPEEIRQRIYFYVDTSAVRNGEVLDRIYLNNAENYTYTMFGQGTLQLGETVYNDARIKWHWVYDVLGYYVLGSWDEASEEFSAYEYLRPIEYDYDEATTAFETDDDGNLTGEVTSIDGMPPEEFLLSVSEKDGYPDVIDIADTCGGYYKVDVDEDGYGVWAYLCTYDEIVENTRYDTALGASTLREKYRAVLTFSAQNSNAEFVYVRTAEGLIQALSESSSASKPAFIQLESDVRMTNVISLGESDRVMLDLNGFDLQLASGTYANKTAGIDLSAGSSLTVINGSLSDADDTGIAMNVNGAELAMSNVSISDMECALYVRDDLYANSLDSSIRIVGCNFETTEEAIYFSGNGDASAQRSKLTVENSTINSGYAGIMGNGSANRAGTDLQVIRSDIEGLYAGIYNPQDNSSLTVFDSVVTGNSGIVLKGGTTNIIESTVRGIGDEIPPTEMPVSGFNDTGDGIYIETNYGYEIALRISRESTIESENGEAIRVFEENDPNVSVEIISAYLNGEFFASDNGEFVDAADAVFAEETEIPMTEETQEVLAETTVLPATETSESSTTAAPVAEATEAADTSVETVHTDISEPVEEIVTTTEVVTAAEGI